MDDADWITYRVYIPILKRASNTRGFRASSHFASDISFHFYLCMELTDLTATKYMYHLNSSESPYNLIQ